MQRAWRARRGSHPASSFREPYSTAEDELIRTSTLPVTELAAQLGRSAQSVYHRRARLGITGEDR